jgi:hypothetical protein
VTGVQSGFAGKQAASDRAGQGGGGTPQAAAAARDRRVGCRDGRAWRRDRGGDRRRRLAGWFRGQFREWFPGIPGAVPQQTPAGPFIGSGTCFYWLHTHAADGIVHIESPVQRTYTLGDFFDEWGQPLGPDQVGPAKGHVTVIYNGKVFEQNPRDVPLTAHAQIQLEVGTPLVAPESITWPNGL